MSIIRIAFVILAVSAISATAYVGFYGGGGESLDLDRSVRTGSGGLIRAGGSVK